MAGLEISELDGVFNGKIIKLNGGFSAAISYVWLPEGNSPGMADLFKSQRRFVVIQPDLFSVVWYTFW